VTHDNRAYDKSALAVAAQAYYDFGSAYGWENLGPDGRGYWMGRVAAMLDALAGAGYELRKVADDHAR
jgi:hypothetical protein